MVQGSKSTSGPVCSCCSVDASVAYDIMSHSQRHKAALSLGTKVLDRKGQCATAGCSARIAGEGLALGGTLLGGGGFNPLAHWRDPPNSVKFQHPRGSAPVNMEGATTHGWLRGYAQQ